MALSMFVITLLFLFMMLSTIVFAILENDGWDTKAFMYATIVVQYITGIALAVLAIVNWALNLA